MRERDSCRSGLLPDVPPHARVVVPRDEIQVFGQIKVIERVVGKSHEVVRQEMLGAVGADHLELLRLKYDVGAAREAGEIQREAGVVWCARLERHGNL